MPKLRCFGVQIKTAMNEANTQESRSRNNTNIGDYQLVRDIKFENYVKEIKINTGGSRK